MTLHDLPDFQQPLHCEHGLIYYPFEGKGSFILLPKELALDTDTEGALDFSLEFIRGEFAGRPPAAQGRLSFGMAPRYPLEDALEWLRQDRALATISPARFAAGTFRLLPLTTAIEIPTDLLQPNHLRWASAEAMRCQLSLSPSTATLVRNSLEGELLPLQAFAELEMDGVAPRLAIEVEFDRLILLAALHTLCNQERIVARAQLVDFFQQLTEPLPYTLSRSLQVEEMNDFSEAMVDYVAAELGAYIPAPHIEGSPYLQLQPSNLLQTTRLVWDLAIPRLVKRRIGLLLDPFTAAQHVVREQGIDRVVIERIIPYLSTGFHQLYVSANVPLPIQGVLSSGVTIRLPPNPPWRRHEIVEDVEPLSGRDEVSLRLRLSPREKLVYYYSTFLRTEGNEGSQLIRGPEILHQDETLRLGVNDYPIRFATLSFDPSLLEIATIQGRYRWLIGEMKHEEAFHLAQGKEQITLFVPQEVDGVELAVDAVAKNSGKVLSLEALPFRNQRIGCFSFPTYGSHNVEIHCQFVGAGIDPNMRVMAELLPEAQSIQATSLKIPVMMNTTAGANQSAIRNLQSTIHNQEEHISTIYFTPELTQKTWHWFAPSPFEAGYRYRVRRRLEQTVPEWSPVQPPFAPLYLQIQVDEGDDEMTLPGDTAFAELIYFADPVDLDHYFYLPGKPSPATDPQGAPLLQLLIAGETAFLQVNVLWNAPAATLEALRQKLSDEKFNSEPALPRLSIAAVEVEKVELLLKVGEEDKVLASSPSSGTPAFSALFSAQLNEEEQNLTIAALHQREELLRVRYHIVRLVAVEMRVTLEGDVVDAWTELDSSATIDVCRDWILQAMNVGKLTLTRIDSPLATPELWQGIEEMAITQAAQWLYAHLQPQSQRVAAVANLSDRVEHSHLTLTVFHSASRSISLTRESDIATWFSSGQGDEHIRIVG